MVNFLLVSGAFCAGQEQVSEIICSNFNYRVQRLPCPFSLLDQLKKKGELESLSKVPL